LVREYTLAPTPSTSSDWIRCCCWSDGIRGWRTRTSAPPSPRAAASTAARALPRSPRACRRGAPWPTPWQKCERPPPLWGHGNPYGNANGAVDDGMRSGPGYRFPFLKHQNWFEKKNRGKENQVERRPGVGGAMRGRGVGRKGST